MCFLIFPELEFDRSILPNSVYFSELGCMKYLSAFVVEIDEHPYLPERTLTWFLMPGAEKCSSKVRTISAKDRVEIPGCACSISCAWRRPCIWCNCSLYTPLGVWSSSSFTSPYFKCSQIFGFLRLLLCSCSLPLYESMQVIQAFCFWDYLRSTCRIVSCTFELFLYAWGLEMLLPWVGIMKGSWFCV